MIGQLAPVLKYSGSKWNIAEWIVGHLPPHEVYVEPFLGSGAVLFCKPRCRLEVANDLDGEVVNLFRVLRDEPEELARLVALTPYAREEYVTCRRPAVDSPDLERARRFLVRSWQQVGHHGGWRVSRRSHRSPADVWRNLPQRIRTAAERLQGVHIDCRPALDLIARYAQPETCLYVDPPYPHAMRDERLYTHEMSDADHRALLDALEAHPGPVLLSGYCCDLYNRRLRHWQRRDTAARNLHAAARTETLWLNPIAWKRLQERQPTLW